MIKVNMKINYLIFLSLISACHSENSSQPIIQKKTKNEYLIQLADVTNGRCLSLEKLMSKMNNLDSNAQAASFVTAFKSIDNIPLSAKNFFSYSAFNYKKAHPGELALFGDIKQKGCESIEMKSASGHVLYFKIQNFDQNRLSLNLVNKFKKDLHISQKKSLFERAQPFFYEVELISSSSLKITERYKTLDPLCMSKKLLSFEIQKSIDLADSAENLPQKYNINSDFYHSVIGSIHPENSVSSLELLDSLTVEQILQMMNSPLKDELKLCHQLN